MDEKRKRNMGSKLKIKCPLCQKVNQTIVYFSRDKAGYAYCHECKICYTNWDNINNKSDNIKDMRSVYFDSEGNNPCIRFGAEFFIPKLSESGNKGNFLDIGFAHPAVLDVAKEYGYATYGIDINTYPTDETKKHNISVGDFENMTIPLMDVLKDTYSVIWASHVFEHFHDPLKALDKCYSLLNNGGRIYIAMPDISLLWKLGNVKTFPHWRPREHFIIWEMNEWIKRMEKVGLKITFARHNIDQRFTAWDDFQIIGIKEGAE
jgi:SAM-dependent methyltransferase